MRKLPFLMFYLITLNYIYIYIYIYKNMDFYISIKNYTRSLLGNSTGSLIGHMLYHWGYIHLIQITLYIITSINKVVSPRSFFISELLGLCNC